MANGFKMTVEEIEQKGSNWIKNLYYLFTRWQDEKGWEDWKDYLGAIKSNIPEGYKFIRATNDPFSIIIEKNGQSRITCDWTGISFTQVK